MASQPVELTLWLTVEACETAERLAGRDGWPDDWRDVIAAIAQRRVEATMAEYRLPVAPETR